MINFAHFLGFFNEPPANFNAFSGANPVGFACRTLPLRGFHVIKLRRGNVVEAALKVGTFGKPRFRLKGNFVFLGWSFRLV